MGKKREFDPAEQVEVIVKFIQNYFIENGNPNTKAIIGISGGKDSTIAAALLVRALGADRVHGVLMPCGTQTDIAYSYEVCKTLGIKYDEVNIEPAVDAFYGCVGRGDCEIPAIRTNVPARMRMVTLYAVAAIYGGRVCNTGNASERFIGYTTKYGDLAGDFALFTDLTIREIYAIGDYLELPEYLVHKAPADGMTGKTDEETTGIPYNVIDDFLLEGKHPEDMKIYEKMITAHKRNIHKQCINLPKPYRIGPSFHYNGIFNDEWVF